MPAFYFDIKNISSGRKLFHSNKSFIHSYKFYPGIIYNTLHPYSSLLHFKRIHNNKNNMKNSFKLDKLFSVENKRKKKNIEIQKKLC